MSRSLDGVDDQINCGSGANIDNLAQGDLSGCIWMRIRTLSSTSTDTNYRSRLMQKRATSVASAGWLFNLRDSQALQFTSIEDIVGADAVYISNTSAFSLNVWAHAAFVYTFSTKTAKLYVNGVEVSYATQTVGDGTAFNDADNSLSIGRSNIGVETQVVDGDLAFAELFSRILTINEIRQLMSYPGSMGNSWKGFWPLWGTAFPEPDYSGNGNNGTVTGATKGAGDPPVNGIYFPRKRRVIPFTPEVIVPPSPVVAVGRRITRSMVGVGL